MGPTLRAGREEFATIWGMADRPVASLRTSFAEAVVSVSKNGEVIKRYLSDMVEEVQACPGPAFPKGLGDHLYKTDGGKWDQWVAYRGCDPGALEHILRTGSVGLVKRAASNPAVQDEWIETCMLRGQAYASAVVLGLPEDKILEIYHNSKVAVSASAFERVVAAAFKAGPEHLEKLYRKKAVANFEVYVHNILGVAGANLESLRWYSRMAHKDLWKGRRDVLVNDVDSWTKLVRELPRGQRGLVIQHLLPGGVVDRLRAMRFDGDDLCDGLSEKKLRGVGTWRNASWRSIDRRKLTRRGVKKILKADRYPRGFVGMLQRYDITVEGLERYADLKNRLECGGWIDGGTISGLARQDALVPYLLDRIESTPEAYKSYDYSGFWSSLHKSKSSWRTEAARRCKSLLQYADPAHVDEDMFIAAGEGEWRGAWLEHCYTTKGWFTASWAVRYAEQCSVRHFSNWDLEARKAVLERVRVQAGDTVTVWETTRALLSSWQLGAEKLVASVQKLETRA